MYPHEEQLLWAAIVHVSVKHAQASDKDREKRPQATYASGDVSTLWSLVCDVREEYSLQQLDARSGGPNQDFMKAKSVVFVRRMEKDQFSDEKRNFYSSVVSTYLGWDYRGISKEAERLAKAVGALSPDFGDMR